VAVPEHIRSTLRELPDKPGVYVMRDRRGKVIYIGKAASLRRRVQSYFRRGTLKSADPKLRGLIHAIHDLETLRTRTEAEATITEARLIKEYRPRYNILLKDDKRFLLLKINLHDPWPRFSTARIRKDDGATYFGPYTNSAAARAALGFVEKRFGLRRCRPLHPDKETYRHCLDDIIRFCSAPCVGRITLEAYHEHAAEACAFLRGERPELLREVREQMAAAAEARQYEKAAALRDTLNLLQRATRKRARMAKPVPLKKAEAAEGLRQLRDALGLAYLPKTIEMFDISNISGTLSVASMVCARDGMPDRKRYRLYRIRSVSGIDDPASIAEVVSRRYRRLLEERKPLPDLVLVDGGITQVRAARERLDQLGLDTLPAAGLAKQREELFLPERGAHDPICLPERSPGLEVVRRIRDEAHRFAITYHRKLRARRIRESILDDIPGIGAKRKQQLLEHFSSIARLRKATIEEIRAVPGFGVTSARLVHDFLRTHRGR